MQTDTLVQTPGSSLLVHPFNDCDIIATCVQDVQNTLCVKPPITVYGKQCRQQRDVGFFAEKGVLGYRYSGQVMPAQPMTHGLEEMLGKVNQQLGATYNAILVNRYAPQDYIGAHSDSEKSLDPNAGVASLSYGAERIFRIKRKANRKNVCDVRMKSGMLLQMCGNFQKEFTHEIPIQKKAHGLRYSFTFRKHAVDVVA